MMPVDQYFIRRQVESSTDHEESYWVNAIDPDGVVRDFTAEHERTRYLKDVHQEVAFIKSLPPGRVLDVGCGLGFLLSALGEGWEKHGVEISKFAASHARRWASVHLGTLKSARYPSGSFDLVVMHHVIEHLSDPVSSIQEVHRILRASGTLVLATPDFDSGCARRFGGNYRLLHDSTHISLFSNESMHRFLRDFGFVIDRVEYPFFETRHFSMENLERLFDPGQISPPFYGNFMTFFCHKPTGGAAYTSFSCRRSRWLNRAETKSAIIDTIARSCVTTLVNGHTLWLYCASRPSWFAQWLRERGVLLIETAMQTTESFPSGVAALGSSRVLIAPGLQNPEPEFSAGDMILAMSPGQLEPELRAELTILQERNGLSFGAMAGCGDDATNDPCSDILIMDLDDSDTGGPEIMAAFSALAARCRELIDGN